MMMRRHSLSHALKIPTGTVIGAWILFSLGAVFASADQAAAETPAGRLVIVGGALSPENEAIFRSFVELASPTAPVGVIPLASGVPEESGPLTVQDIQQFAANPSRVFDTKLTTENAGDASVPKTEATLSGCQALWFTGGDQSRIVDVLRPESGDTIGYQAVKKVLSSGGTIGGTSAGAAMMSDPMIRSGDSEEAMRVGATAVLDGPGVCIGKGMGLFPYGLTDQHFLRRGRFGRLLVAIEASDNRFGFGVSENSALVVDLDSQLGTTIGDQAVTIIDRQRATVEGGHRKNLRIHLIGGGDQYDFTSNEVIPSAEKTAYKSRAEPARTFDDIWSRRAIASMLSELANDPDRSVTGKDKTFRYVMQADSETKFLSSESDRVKTLTAINVRLDISPIESP